MVKSSTYVKFAPLFIRKEGEKYLIGHAKTGTTRLIPALGYQVIELLREKPVEEVERRLSREKKPANVSSFVETLKEAGLIEEVGPSPYSNLEHEYFARRKGRLWFLGGLTLISLSLGLMAGFLFLTHPSYRPSGGDFFWSEQNFKNLLSLFAASFFLVWTHEGAHAFAGWWGGGIKAQFSFSYRFIFLVAQTKFPLVWKLPRLERSLIYLAGMVWDVFWISSLIIVSHSLKDNPHPPLPLGLLRQLILFGVLEVGWQFFFILRNDLYFLFSDLAKKFNLHEEAFAFVWSLVKLKPVRADRITKAYAAVMVGGSFLVLKLYGLIPLGILSKVVQATLLSMRSYPSPEFFDAALVSLYFATHLLLYSFLLGRDVWKRSGFPT